MSIWIIYFVMKKAELLFRKAVVSDVPFICKTVLSAIGALDFEKDNDRDCRRAVDALNDIVLMEDSLYSYRNVLIAEVEGLCAGSIIAYDGGRYKDMKGKTFRILTERLEMDFRDTQEETSAGEYYLDSLAVTPAFRRKGIGRMLVGQALEAGEALGFEKASLLVLASDEGLISLYSSCGFKEDGHKRFLGKNYLRMIAQLQ